MIEKNNCLNKETKSLDHGVPPVPIYRGKKTLQILARTETVRKLATIDSIYTNFLVKSSGPKAGHARKIPNVQGQGLAKTLQNLSLAARKQIYYTALGSEGH